MNAADTILEQLGGGKFLAMTGAKNLVAMDKFGLQFDLPKRRINAAASGRKEQDESRSDYVDRR